MKKIVFLLAVIAVVVLLFAPVATAKKAYKGGGKSTSTSTAMSTAMASGAAGGGKLPKTGGPAPVSPIALLAGVVLVSSGLAALTYLRREGS